MDPITRASLTGALMALFSTIGLAACSERPQRVAHEGDAALAGETWDAQLRDRTLKQGESGRMSY
jgi:hypothetical protein